jgi:Putative zinc-finger
VSHDVSCPLAELDGAYVLGALSAADRTRFEEHLAHCPACRASVQELAGLPGLLSRVPVEQLVAPEPVPDALWPRLVARSVRTRRRDRWRSATIGLAVAACVIALVGVGWSVLGGHSGPSNPAGRPAQTLAFTPLGGVTGLQAKASVEQVAWGTRIVMQCSGTGAAYRSQPYSLVVVLRDGRTVTTAYWLGVPDKTLRLEGDVSVPRAQIAAVEVRSENGIALLRLRL